ncbi:MAG: LLM class flavin-dependent oxidoreductase [Dermatophilaceae bacterium]
MPCVAAPTASDDRRRTRPAVRALPTPDAAAADHLVELTRVAETVGLDLVSIPDHPYQRKPLDTWTLLSDLGAATTSIRLARTSPTSRSGARDPDLGGRSSSPGSRSSRA